MCFKCNLYRRYTTAEALLELMSTSGVHGALIVQPINLLFDHSYVASVIAKYPGRFVGCWLVGRDFKKKMHRRKGRLVCSHATIGV